MKKQLIPVICVFHCCAIFWWTVPYSFGNLLFAPDQHNTFGSSRQKWVMLADNPRVEGLLKTYINITGNQQYWDFFAPHSVRFHQYLSVCEAVTFSPDQEKIICNGQPLFSNLEHDLDQFQGCGSKRSRLYRLTENLIKLKDPALLSAFTSYYRPIPLHQHHTGRTAHLIAHQYELHPEFNDLPRAGYRFDTILLSSP